VSHPPAAALQRLLLPLVLLSSISNLAVLVSPVFMMQVLDRVVPSGNLHTLGLLLAIALAAVALQHAVEFIRENTLQRSGRWLERVCLPQILSCPGPHVPGQLQGLTAASAHLRGPAALALIDLPWLPLFLFALLLVHWSFCLLALAVAGLLAAVRWAAASQTQTAEAQCAAAAGSEQAALSSATDYAALSGMPSLAQNLLQRYAGLQANRHGLEDGLTYARAAQKAGLGYLRTVSQLLGLALGAALVASGGLTAGGMIAASIILSKTVLMLDSAWSSRNDMIALARELGALSQSAQGSDAISTEIAELSGSLRCETLVFPRGGGAPPRLDRVSLSLDAGECLAIVGASGSGKTTLLLAMAGISPCPIGAVFLDETEIRSLPPASLARHIGYLPQQAVLFPGTLAGNICGFDPQPDDAKIVTAAKTAGVHGLISALPSAYETDAAAEGHLLSAGQKQRVALARAIYGAPRYLFLDEPNALLDGQGERQLCDALTRLKSAGTTIVMVLHRSGVMGLADKVLVMDGGKCADFGPRAEVLGRMGSGRRRIKLPLRPDSLQDLSDWVSAQFSRAGDAAFCQRAQVVAAELFAAALANGPDKEARHAVFEFTFVDDTRCEITLSEDHPTAAGKKVQKVEGLLAQPQADLSSLPVDEMALALIAQLSDRMSVCNIEGRAMFFAALSSTGGALPGATAH
jgi:ABC-type protease/lipase transport system fused ATPase/permease subunit